MNIRYKFNDLIFLYRLFKEGAGLFLAHRLIGYKQYGGAGLSYCDFVKGLCLKAILNKSANNASLPPL